ncbi:SAM-dependent methyltransferase [Lacinutrix sp. Bg11-31]|uniref:THUMP-like domain-containing protein n=1 Tax=Lacinutrix sp. Bg11-31 TaxID=2057808 RepID=UPI000C30A376|nr:SAM-dependent methyltransferase [Lacinutrix sp. Bg11-31]AUC81563.1 SAM-dependent methyltransferase [Lacinutrix sp. Bg11-31]
MNKEILNTENQIIIYENINSDINKFSLKGVSTSTANTKELVNQIEAKKKCQKKLPTWFSTKNIYYPNKLNIEQTSSETTAQYKSNLVCGDALIDLTGGFGVDCYYFSKQVKNVFHCEINENLSKIVQHNYKQLNVDNITCIAKSGITALEEEKKHYNWIYIDPSRRNDIKGKVFLLKDCLPSVPEHIELLFKYSKNIMIKTSPLLDISSGISELSNVKAIHCIAVNNEVKELLWVLERDYNNEIEIKTANITKENKQEFNFYLNEEFSANVELSQPLAYLYEPNAAILKAGAFEVLADKLNLKKLHKHSHLYTSEKLINFPGRSFKINNVLEYNKKKFKREFKNVKANVTTRNFPETVQQIRKKLNLKDGGDDYLFFTKNIENKTIIIITTKA